MDNMRKYNEKILSKMEKQMLDQYQLKNPSKDEIKENVNEFVKLLNITYERGKRVKNYRNPVQKVFVDNIWTFKNRKIAVCFISETDQIKLTDLIAMVSILKDDYLSVNHGLFLCFLDTKKEYEFGSGTLRSRDILLRDGYRDVLLEIEIEKPILLRIFAINSLVSDEKEQKNLALHLDIFSERGKPLNLFYQLTELIKAEPPYPDKWEKPRYEDMTG